MTEKLCLRCDWNGVTRARACPRCGASLFRPPGSTAPRRRRSLRRREARSRPASTATPGAESFDAAASSRPIEAPAVTHRGGWLAVGLVVLIAAIVVAVVQGSTPPPPPSAPAPDLHGELLYASAENLTRSRLWIWDLETGGLRQGPSILRPIELVSANGARAGAGWVGWVGLTASTETGQEAALLRNFSSNDFAIPLLEGKLVAWAPDGKSVTAATKDGSDCSVLRVESRFISVAEGKTLFDDVVCGAAVALARDHVSAHVGVSGPDGPSISHLRDGVLSPYLEDASLLAVDALGDSLVVPQCGKSTVGVSGSVACGGVTFVDARNEPLAVTTVRYGDRSDRVLAPERFLGWSSDGTHGFILGSYGETRGVYTVPVPNVAPTPPRLVLASLATNVYLTESYDGDLYLSRDGALLLIRASGEQIQLSLPEGAPEPDGPILWLQVAGGST